MRRYIFFISLLFFCVGIFSQPLPYRDTNLSTEERAQDLLSRLTLEEKVSLMMHRSPAIERLGVPQFQWWCEALHGVGRNSFATVFPITTCMAASFNDTLVENVFTAVSDEARVKELQASRNGEFKSYQGLSFWTPNINIFRDPRWGRGQETYGEDPFLTSKMGLAVVHGLQGPSDARHMKLLACAKHFAVHSGPEWNRHSFNIEDLPERDLWETYLPAFKALVQEGNVAEVMCAYQRIDGQACCANARFERQILREEWGFNGLIVSDCGAINDFWQEGRHNVAQDASEASVIAVRNGTDLECGSNYTSLTEAVEAGQISEQEIDKSLLRLLIARFRLGNFDPEEEVEWTKISPDVVCSDAHSALALEMARQGTVLLKNDNEILPLSYSDAKKVAIMGPNANDSVMMWGNYNGFPVKTITILKGLQNKLGPAVPYIQGCEVTQPEVLVSRFSQITTPEGEKGMSATYWNNVDMKGEPVAKQVLAEPINLCNGGSTVFCSGVALEYFSARYEGFFTPTADETLTISLGCDDKCKLIIDKDTLFDGQRGRDRIIYSIQEYEFKAGKTYHIEIDFVQQDGMAVFQFDLAKKSTPSANDILQALDGIETVIFVGGISSRLEGEEMHVNEPGFRGGDRTDIELPQVQRDILKLLHDAGKHIILINCSGGAMGLVPETSTCDAIIQAWYGGEQGGNAVADIIMGDYNPNGRLPLTFYKDVSQLPDYEDYRMEGRTYRYFKGEPAFPFGHGLSYTTFVYSNPRYDSSKGILSVDLTNTGNRDGDEVVQVYIKNISDVSGPQKSLRSYRRISTKANQTQTVEIPLGRESFEGWDTSTNSMRVVSGEYYVMVGGSSADDALQTIKVIIE